MSYSASCLRSFVSRMGRLEVKGRPKSTKSSRSSLPAESKSRSLVSHFGSSKCHYSTYKPFQTYRYYSSKPIPFPEKPTERFGGPQDGHQRQDIVEKKCREGIDHRDSGNTVEALKCFTHAIELSNETSFRAYSLRADIYHTTGQFQLALDDYKRVLKFLPTHVPTHTSVASCYKKLGQAERALRQFDDILAFEPQYAPAIVGKAECHASLGKHREAAQLYQEALKHTDKFVPEASVFQALGDSLLMTNDVENSIKAYEESLKLKPMSAVTWGAYGVVLYLAKQFAKSCDAYSEALRLGGSPRYDLFAKRASCYLHFGNTEKAMEDCSAALALHPSYYKALMIRGQCRLETDPLGAIADFDAFLKEVDVQLQEQAKASAEAMSQHWRQVSSIRTLRATAHLQAFCDHVERFGGPLPDLDNVPPSAPQKETLEMFDEVYQVIPLVKETHLLSAWDDLVEARKLNSRNEDIFPLLYTLKKLLALKFNSKLV